MKIVFIEDSVDYRKSFVDLMKVCFPQIKKGDILEAGLFEQSKALLQSFVPPKGERTVFLVDSTLDYSPKDDFGIPGNGFDLVANWLNTFLTKATNDSDQETLDNLKNNVSLIINSTYTREQIKRFESYQFLKATSQENLAGFSALSKRDGPESFIETIGKLLGLPQEGGKRRKEG